MAPGGQGALIDVCDGKAHSQHPCGPPHPGWATSPSGLSCGLEVSRGGELDTGALKVPGLGRPPRPSRQEGALSPREGESLA